MLLVLLRGHTSISGDHQLMLTIMIGIVIGLIVTSIGNSKYETTAKVFLFSLIIETLLCSAISLIHLAWGIGIYYGALFGTIFILIINHFSSRKL